MDVTQHQPARRVKQNSCELQKEVMITREEETNRNAGMPSLNGKQVTMWSFCSRFISSIRILQNKTRQYEQYLDFL